MSELTLDAMLRNDIGKGASRRLRRKKDQLPAILYGAGKDPVSLTLEHNAVLKALKNDAFYSSILSLQIDGKAESVVLKDMQRHPFKPKIQHMDFLRIKAGEKITMSVPLRFINEAIAPGVTEGGMVTHLTTEVEIRCLPKNLPEYLEVDMSNITLDQTLHLSDLTLPNGIEILALTHDIDAAVVNIHIAKAAPEPTEAPETEASPTAEGDKKDDTEKDKS